MRGGPGRTRRILTTTTANGVLSFSNMDLHNASTLYIQRAWEIDLIRRSMEFLAKEGLLRPGKDLMIDAGANIGMICIALLKHGYFREAIALEPGPENFALLTRNIAQNGMNGRIRAMECAISDAPGQLEMELSGENFGDHRVRSLALGPALMGEVDRGTIAVPARTLDDVVADLSEEDRGRIGLLWMDVQGHDGQVLRGARETIARGVPVVNELWPYGIARSGLTRDAYLELLRTRFVRVATADLASGDFVDRNPGELAALYDANSRPEQALAMIGLPR